MLSLNSVIPILTEKYPVSSIESGYFSEKDFSVPKIPGYTGNLAKEGTKLTMQNPLSEVISAGENFFVCCWKSTKPSFLPEFRDNTNKMSKVSEGEEESSEQNSDLSEDGKKAERDLKNELAIAKARENCREIYEEIMSLFEQGTEFSDIKGSYDFKITEEFNLFQGPRGQNAEVIKKIAKETKAGMIAAPKDVDNGGLLVYIDKHLLPTLEEYEKVKSFWLVQYEQEQQQAALNHYYEKLKKESDTKISDDWQFILRSG